MYIKMKVHIYTYKHFKCINMIRQIFEVNTVKFMTKQRLVPNYGFCLVSGSVPLVPLYG